MKIKHALLVEAVFIALGLSSSQMISWEESDFKSY